MLSALPQFSGLGLIQNDANSQGIYIREPSALLKCVEDLRRQSIEHFAALYVSADFRLICKDVVSIGNSSKVVVDVLSMLTSCKQFGAVGFMVAHNHPSGIAKPSRHDINFTKSLVIAAELCGFVLFSHVIVTRNDQYFFNL